MSARPQTNGHRNRDLSEHYTALDRAREAVRRIDEIIASEEAAVARGRKLRPFVGILSALAVALMVSGLVYWMEFAARVLGPEPRSAPSDTAPPAAEKAKANE